MSARCDNIICLQQYKLFASLGQCIWKRAGRKTRVVHVRVCAPFRGIQVAKVDEAVSASVEEELQRLRKENELLRQQLLLYQQASGGKVPVPQVRSADSSAYWYTKHKDSHKENSRCDRPCR